MRISCPARVASASTPCAERSAVLCGSASTRACGFARARSAKRAGSRWSACWCVTTMASRSSQPLEAGREAARVDEDAGVGRLHEKAGVPEVGQSHGSTVCRQRSARLRGTDRVGPSRSRGAIVRGSGLAWCRASSSGRGHHRGERLRLKVGERCSSGRVVPADGPGGRQRRSALPRGLLRTEAAPRRGRPWRHRERRGGRRRPPPTPLPRPRLRSLNCAEAGSITDASGPWKEA